MQQRRSSTRVSECAGCRNSKRPQALFNQYLASAAIRAIGCQRPTLDAVIARQTKWQEQQMILINSSIQSTIESWPFLRLSVSKWWRARLQTNGSIVRRHCDGGTNRTCLISESEIGQFDLILFNKKCCIFDKLRDIRSILNSFFKTNVKRLSTTRRLLFQCSCLFHLLKYPLIFVSSVYSRSPILRIVYVFPTWTIKKKKRRNKSNVSSKNYNYQNRRHFGVFFCKWNETVCQRC